MAHTELTQKVIDIASEIQNSEEAQNLAPIFYYLAIRKILDNPELIAGINVDESEMEALKTFISDRNLASSEQVEAAVKNHEYNDDEDEARNLKRWLSIGNRNAVDIIKMIADDLSEDKFTKIKKEKSKDDEIIGESIEETIEETIVDKDDSKKAGRPLSDVVLTTGKLKSAIRKSVFGQDNAINKFVNTFFKGEYLAETDDRKKGPRCLFTFLGMPGVGKTYLAQVAAEAIGRPCLKIDMSNGTLEILGNRPEKYKTRDPKSYYEFVEAYPESILVFDELEKAAVTVILKFLSMIDAGTSAGVDFRDSTIIFTTNAGKPLYTMTEYGRLSNIPDVIIKDILTKEIDPITNKPFFPPEFVSRLAAGTLIMFDRLEASDLIDMTGKEIDRHINNTENRYNYKIEKDSFLDATALFSLGGQIDGRNAVNKGKDFFIGEIFELLMLSSEDRGYEVTDKLKNVKINVELENIPDEVKKLYSDDENMEFVFFAEKDVRERIESEEYKCVVKCPKTLDEYFDILSKDEVTAAFIDYKAGIISEDDTLNVEDIISDGRYAFEKTVEKYPEIVTYIFSFEHNYHNNAEKDTLISNGAHDVVVLPCEIKKFIETKCREVCLNNALETLRLRHKVLNYNMRQRLSDDEETAIVSLYNLELKDAIEADDKKAIMSEDDLPDMTWDDIVVSKKVQEDLEYYISYLKDPKGFLAKAKAAPKGVLFYGPPGTGKTTIAKVVASVAGVRFIATAGANFQSKWAGETTQNVISAFNTARRNAPCVLFIDEIDAIATKRSEVPETSGGATKDQNAVVTALLDQMDGFKKSVKKPVFVIAATNKLESLDPAVLRRFDKHILLGNPDKEGRIKVLKLLRKKNSEILKITDEFIENLAVRSINCSPAELEKAVNDAIGMAIRNNTVVTDDVMDEAFETSIFGEEKKWDEGELLRVARHEVGHAFISHYYGNTPDYLTIVARGDHGGYSMSVGDEKKGLSTKPEKLHRICMSLGGRAAEEIFYGEEDGVSTGPSGDLFNATRTAKDMICQYGMSNNLGLISTSALDSSDALNDKILSEIKDILNEQFENAKRIITENMDQFEKLVNALMSNQSMTSDDIKEVLSSK